MGNEEIKWGMKLKPKVRKLFCHMTQFVLQNLTANNMT